MVIICVVVTVNGGDTLLFEDKIAKDDVLRFANTGIPQCFVAFVETESLSRYLVTPFPSRNNEIQEIKVADRLSFNRSRANTVERYDVPQEIDKFIYYNTSDSLFSKKSSRSLDKIVHLMRLYPDLDIEIAAHTDSRGSKNLNQKLSEQRAVTVKIYLITRNIR